MSLIMGINNVTPGEGSLEAKIAIIGDVPMNVTTKNIFEQCLHIAGLTRGDCYITNIFKDKRTVDSVYDKKKKKFLISPQAQQTYTAEIIAELQTLKANVIVLMGEAALQIFAGKNSIVKWRGTILELYGRKMIPVTHPADTFRDYLSRYPLISDFRRVRKHQDEPRVIRPERELILAPTFDMATDFLKQLRHDYKRVSFDIECNGAYECSCIAFAPTPKLAMTIPFYKDYWREQEEIHIWKLIAQILEDPQINKVGQNLMFDLSFLLMQNSIVSQGRFDDTMIAQAILYPDFPKGLDFQTSIYTEEPYYKDEGKIWKNPDIDKLTFWRYNAKDAAVTMEIMENHDIELDKQGNRNAYEKMIKLLNPMIFMQVQGIKANLTKLKQTKIEVDAQVDQLQLELNTLCGKELNVASSKQCQVYFYVELGIKPYMSKGVVTTDDKAMQRIARAKAAGWREAQLVKQIRELRKLSSTYLDIKFDSDNRLRCSYNVVGTSTGRQSSSQTIFGTGANFQNIPPDVREFLEADEGYILVECDKVQAEWIGVAYISGDANMIEVVEKKLDAHKRTASLMYDVAYNEVSKDQRSRGKTCNHSLNYDMGFKSYAIYYGIQETEAKNLVRLYHAAYPGIRLWHERVRQQLSTNRTLTNCFGRVRRFMDRWGDDLFKAAYAFNPQSSIVEIVNDAIIDIYYDTSETMKPLQMIGQIHDSILSQVPMKTPEDVDSFINILQRMTKYLDRTAIGYGGREFIVPTEVKLGYDWKNLTGIMKGDYDWEMLRKGLKCHLRIRACMKCTSSKDCIAVKFLSKGGNFAHG